LERSYKDYLDGYVDAGKQEAGYLAVTQELLERFPDPSEIVKESDKKAFVDLFGKFLKLDNILQNYDDFVRLQAVQMLDFENPEEVAAFQA
ncbi:hypothetical protein, partial [Streptococcus suis]